MIICGAFVTHSKNTKLSQKTKMKTLIKALGALKGEQYSLSHQEMSNMPLLLSRVELFSNEMILLCRGRQTPAAVMRRLQLIFSRK